MSKQNSAVEAISLDSVINAMKQWREAKKAGKSRVIPDELWRQIFSLAQSYDPKVLRGLLVISKEQYDNKYRQFIEGDDHKSEEPASLSTDTSAFCEVKMVSPYEPSPLPKPASNLVVVEIYRPDKSLLKIHTTAEQLDKVVQSFLAAKGETDVANHE